MIQIRGHQVAGVVKSVTAGANVTVDDTDPENPVISASGGGGGGGTLDRCRLKRVATQTIPNNTVTDISWDSEIEDTASMWESASPTEIVAPATGLYRVTGYIGLAYSSSTGIYQLEVHVNGTLAEVLTRGDNDAANAGTPVFKGGVAFLDLTADDVVTLSCFQNTGASRDTYATISAYAPRVCIERLV